MSVTRKMRISYSGSFLNYYTPKYFIDGLKLAVEKLPPEQQAAFTASPVPGSVSLPGPALLEPHATWVALLEQAWLKRYGKG